jgi:hypothetical protein
MAYAIHEWHIPPANGSASHELIYYSRLAYASQEYVLNEGIPNWHMPVTNTLKWGIPDWHMPIKNTLK